MNTAVQKDGSSNISQGRVSAQPLSVLSLWRKCLALLDVTKRMPCLPLSLGQFHGLGKLGEQRAVAAGPFHILFIRRLLPLRRIAVSKTGEVHGRDVTQVAHDIHHLVIAEQADNPAASGVCFFLECHHQVQDLAWLDTAIE